MNEDDFFIKMERLGSLIFFTDGWDSLTDMVPPPPAEYELKHVSKDFLDQLEKDTSIFMDVDYIACYRNNENVEIFKADP
jgi:hypothetical protein